MVRNILLFVDFDSSISIGVHPNTIDTGVVGIERIRHCYILDATVDRYMGEARFGPFDVFLHHIRKRREISEESDFCLWVWFSLYRHNPGVLLHLLDCAQLEVEASIPRVSALIIFLNAN